MSNVALRLLTTDAPSETKQDLAASAQLVVPTGTAPTTSYPAVTASYTCYLPSLIPLVTLF